MTPSFNVSPMTLGGGVYLRSTQVNHKFHVDAAHVLHNNALHGIKPTNLGIVDYFISSGFLDDLGSIYDFGAMGKNVRLIDSPDGVYTWKTPESTDDFYVVEDLSCSDKPGIDEQTFRLRFNKRFTGNLSTIATSKFAKHHLLVTEDEILKDGDTWIYTVKLKSQGAKDDYYRKDFLVPGTRYFKVSSYHLPNSTVYDDMGEFSSKMSTFYNYVGQTRAQKHFTVGGMASGMSIANSEVVAMKDYTKVIEMFIFRAGSDAAELQLRGEDPIKKMYKGDVAKAEKDIVGAGWLSAVEAAAMKSLELDIVMEAFWGSGGTVYDSNYVGNSPIGLYHQFNRGNQHFYNIDTFSIGMLNGILSSFLSGRMRPMGSNKIKLTVGEGIWAIIKGKLQNLPSSFGMITNSEKYLAGAVNNMKFSTPVITSYDFAFGTVEFDVNPALNPRVDNDIQNPRIGGFRLSAYMILVTDVTGDNNNVEELRSTDGHEFTHVYKNGKGNYMGRVDGFQGDPHVPYDFTVAMTKKHIAYRLIDPTKAFIIKPYNPRTGLPFGEI